MNTLDHGTDDGDETDDGEIHQKLIKIIIFYYNINRIIFLFYSAI